MNERKAMKRQAASKRGKHRYSDSLAQSHQRIHKVLFCLSFTSRHQFFFLLLLFIRFFHLRIEIVQCALASDYKHINRNCSDTPASEINFKRMRTKIHRVKQTRHVHWIKEPKKKRGGGGGGSSSQNRDARAHAWRFSRSHSVELKCKEKTKSTKSTAATTLMYFIVVVWLNCIPHKIAQFFLSLLVIYFILSSSDQCETAMIESFENCKFAYDLICFVCITCAKSFSHGQHQQQQQQQSTRA